ncbi:MAG: hypothetical protein ACRDGJ_09410, partial [Candidatus Limnocylindria bacterium]
MLRALIGPWKPLLIAIAVVGAGASAATVFADEPSPADSVPVESDGEAFELISEEEAAELLAEFAEACGP